MHAGGGRGAGSLAQIFDVGLAVQWDGVSSSRKLPTLKMMDFPPFANPTSLASLLHNHGVLNFLLLLLRGKNVPVARSRLCLLLAIRLLLQRLDTTLVRLGLQMRLVVGIGFVEFGALDAVEVAKCRELLRNLGLVELLEVTLVVKVLVDLVEVAGVTASLLLGVDSTNGRHDGGRCV